MKDLNKGKDSFNDSFRRKMNEAGYTPSKQVWTGIESELLRFENRKIKRRAAFYRNAAAAIFIIAISLFYFNISKESLFEGRSDSKSIVTVSIEEQINSSPVRNNFDTKMPKVPESSQSAKVESNSRAIRANFQQNNKEEIVKEEGALNSSFVSYSANGQQMIALTSTLDREEIKVPQKFQDLIVVDLPVKKVDYYAVSQRKVKTNSPAIAFNTGVNFGSGSFNPNSEITGAPIEPSFSSLNYPGAAGRGARPLNDNFEERQSIQDLGDTPVRSNVSFTAGLNVGMKIGERWNIRSGLQYGVYRSSSQSNAVIRDFNNDELFPFHGASSANSLSDDRVLNVTSEYEIYNDFEIVSVPLMLTYNILNDRFKVGLLGGISGDLFLSNTIKGGSDQISDVNYGKEDNQPYRNLFMSSLLGVELSYALSNNYSLSLIPTFKKAFNSITDDQANFMSTPSYGSVNMSINYLF